MTRYILLYLISHLSKFFFSILVTIPFRCSSSKFWSGLEASWVKFYFRVFFINFFFSGPNSPLTTYMHMDHTYLSYPKISVWLNFEVKTEIFCFRNHMSICGIKYQFGSVEIKNTGPIIIYSNYYTVSENLAYIFRIHKLCKKEHHPYLKIGLSKSRCKKNIFATRHFLFHFLVKKKNTIIP